MKKFVPLIALALLLIACGGSEKKPAITKDQFKPKAEAPVVSDKGIGEITHVDLNAPLVASMVEKGKGIYEMKCAACHKLTGQRVVGPGWKGLTSKRKPEWIMNMVTNVEVMLEKDPEARELLKQCLVRMPNQNITIEDSRNILEFMYSIDGQEVGAK